MTQAERLHAALKSADPTRALVVAVKSLAADGCSTPDIKVLLENLLVDVRRERRESEENAVLDVLDSLAGWCHVDSRL